MRTFYLKLAVGLLCPTLVVLNLFNFHRDLLREGIILFLFGTLTGYYFTSAAYEGESKEKRTLDGLEDRE